MRALKDGVSTFRRLYYGLCLFGILNAAHAEIAILAWDPSESPNVAGYNVYYGPSSGHYTNTIDVADTLTAQIGGLQMGKTYYFVVTAYSDTGLESGPSNEVQFTPLLKFLGSTLTVQSNGRMQVRIAGPMGVAIVVQASTNLANWKSISTNSLSATDGTYTFMDPSRADSPARFYRAYLMDNSAASSSLLNAITLLK